MSTRARSSAEVRGSEVVSRFFQYLCTHRRPRLEALITPDFTWFGAPLPASLAGADALEFSRVRRVPVDVLTYVGSDWLSGFNRLSDALFLVDVLHAGQEVTVACVVRCVLTAPRIACVIDPQPFVDRAMGAGAA